MITVGFGLAAGRAVLVLVSAWLGFAYLTYSPSHLGLVPSRGVLHISF